MRWTRAPAAERRARGSEPQSHANEIRPKIALARRRTRTAACEAVGEGLLARVEASALLDESQIG